MLALTHDQLRTSAPSIFATRPYNGVSDSYRFVPTFDVIDMMQEAGFYPVKATQSRSRIEDKRPFTKHMIRLRHADNLTPQIVGSEIPEIVLVNAHDKTSAYKIFAGIFRLICSNGAIIQSENFGSFSIRHSGSRDLRQQVIDTTAEIVSSVPAIMGKIETYKQLQLSPPQREAFATAALTLKDTPAITPPQLLEARRPEDKKADLWTVSQTVQENLMKGGLTGRNQRGRNITTRPIKAVDADLRTNRALWVLMEKMAELIS